MVHACILQVPDDRVFHNATYNFDKHIAQTSEHLAITSLQQHCIHDRPQQADVQQHRITAGTADG